MRTNGHTRSLLAVASIIAVISGALSCERRGTGAVDAAQAAQDVFREKNGYFRFAPPVGWVRLDYPDDPRSKVQFSHPSSSRVHLRLIAALAPGHMNQANFINLMRQDMETMRARLGAALRTMELQEGTFAGYTAAFVRASTSAGEQELKLFLADNLFFNVSYEAPDVATLAKHRSAVEQSLGTLLVGKPSQATGSQIRDQRVARYLRLGKLMSEAGQFEIARQFLEDGLAEYPADPDLVSALEFVKARKVPR